MKQTISGDAFDRPIKLGEEASRTLLKDLENAHPVKTSSRSLSEDARRGIDLLKKLNGRYEDYSEKQTMDFPKVDPYEHISIECEVIDMRIEK